MAYPEKQYHREETAKEYTKIYTLESTDEVVIKQEDGMMGYISAGQFATTGSNIFDGGQIIFGNLNIDGDIIANQFIVTTSSVNHFTASTNFGLDEGDTHTFTGSVYITGSLNVIGGINGQINATNGVVSSSAQITAFGFVSGSYETTGRSILSSSAQIKNYGDFATTGSNTFIGNQTITGSFLVSGSTTQIGNNILLGNTIMSGTLDVSGSTTFRGTNKISGAFYIESSSLFYQNTGSALVSYDQTTGELFHTTYASALPAIFAAGGFYSTQTQSGSANQSGSFTFNNTLGVNAITIQSGSHIVCDRPALYNIQFSIQIVQGSQSADLAVWLKRNGVNIPNSATYVTIPSNTKKVVALNLWESTTNVGDYFEIAYQSQRSDTTYEYIAATGNIPASPSIIVTINQVR
jgi:hypothetical protein